MIYTAKGSKVKGFTLTDTADNIIGTISYNSWFSRKADVYLYSNDHYEIIPSGFWQTSSDILHAEYKAGAISMNWRGNMTVVLNEKGYLFKRNNFWSRSFALQMDGREIFSVRQRYDWAKLVFVYEMNVPDNFERANVLLLLLLAVYCANQQYSGAVVT